MNNLAIWEAVRRPPESALRHVSLGNRSFTDVNTAWRMQALTQQFGPCGIGWKYVITERWTDSGAAGEVICNVALELYVAVVGEDGSKAWSEPIPGFGGAMLISRNKNGLSSCDDSWKMATTDSLSVAMKALGVAADIYRGWFDGSKYSKESQPTLAVTEVKHIEDYIRELSNAAVSGGDEALRGVWSTIDVNSREILRDYLRALKAPKTEKLTDDIPPEQITHMEVQKDV
ncbi:MAG: hypothetical protein Q8Q57_12480 [Methylotenera sp.]|nr:hypothetical protein [Methylotenera sp.]